MSASKARPAAGGAKPRARTAVPAPILPPDDVARRRIREDLDTTFLVEAGAGSGKTHSLVERMVALLAAGKCRIDTLAAVTFTRKAAAEMRGRFQMRLEEAVRSGLKDRATGEAWPAEERDRLGEALRYLERAFVGTIHSFCATLLRERPVEAGVDPEFEEVDGLDDRILRDRCWREALDEARAFDDARLRALDGMGLAPGDLRDAFETLCAYSEVRPMPGRPLDVDADALRASLERFLDAAAPLVPDVRPEGWWDGLQWCIVRALRRYRAFGGLRDVRDLMSTLEIFEGPCKSEDGPKPIYKRWKRREDGEKAAELLAGFFRETVEPALRSWREARHQAALEFLRPVRDSYDRKRREDARLNFQDLLTLAADMLRDHPDVRLHFRGRFERILVDEFQDTDPLQAEILCYLAGGEEAERDWRRLTLRPGVLFLVGDPKQSIYRFRRADIDIYNRVKAMIEGDGGEVLRLTANFRSLSCLAGWVNPIFAQEFGPGSEYQAAYAPLETVRGACREAGQGLFTIPLEAVPRHPIEKIAGPDAECVARWIAGALGKGGADRLRLTDAAGTGLRDARPGDFLVLFRYRKCMDFYARALERFGIPYEISGSAAFADSEEVLAVAALLRLLADPDDEVRTAGVLRGLFFGCSDQDLLDYADAGGRFRMDAPPPSPGPDRDAEGIERAASALARLRGWRDAARVLPPSGALETIIEESGLMARVAAEEMGSSRAGNVFKLLDLVRGAETEGSGSLAEAALRVEDVLEDREIEEMSLSPGRPGAVRLMNLHKAKGLESPVVVLANPVGQKDHDPDAHVRREAAGAGAGTRVRRAMKETPARGEGFFLFMTPNGPHHKIRLSQPAGWAEVEEKEREYRRAEEGRLMYVAATRARDLMVISLYGGDLGERQAWRLLNESAVQLPNLDLAAVGSLEPDAPEAVDARKSDRESGRKERVRRLEEIRLPTYRLETVTSIARAQHARAAWAAGGFGLKWGTAVHALLNRLGRRADRGEAPPSPDELERMVRRAVDQAEMDADQVAPVLSLVRSILESEFWGRVLRAERRFFEIPFASRADAAAVPEAITSGGGEGAGRAPKGAAEPNGASDLVVAGALDLAFLEPDGWVIADYKTDFVDVAAGTEAVRTALRDLVDHYAPQVRLYTRFWERMTGGTVKESGLFFTSIGYWQKIGGDARPRP